jgi:hypothetical protein
MKKIKALTMTIIFWVLLIIISSVWLVLLIINNITFGKINIFLLLIFIVAGLSFSLSIYFIYQIIFDTRVELKKALEKEKSLEDIIKMDNS